MNSLRLADQEAAARKGQYDQFLAESTALADRREASRTAAPATAAVLPVEAASANAKPGTGASRASASGSADPGASVSPGPQGPKG